MKHSWDLKSHLQEGPGQDRQHIYGYTTKYISLHTQFTQNIYNQVTLQLDPLKYI